MTHLPVAHEEMEASEGAQPLDVEQGDDQTLGGELGDGVDGFNRLEDGVLGGVLHVELREEHAKVREDDGRPRCGEKKVMEGRGVRRWRTWLRSGLLFVLKLSGNF